MGPELRRNRCEARMPTGFLASSFVTLVLVVDPLGLVPSFISITHDLPERARRDVALRAAFIAATILAGSALISDWLLRTLAISLPAFRIAGGCFRSPRKWCSACASNGSRARAQHCRLPACQPADGWPRRDHGNGG